MNGDKWSSDDEQAWARLADALSYDPQREPHTSRVAAIRAAAAELRHQEPDAGAGRTRGGNVVPLPRRRQVLIGGVAAAVGTVAGFAARDLVADDPGGSDVPAGPPTELIAFSSPPGVQADARLINHTWGTELLLDVSGLPAGETYRVVYGNTTGETEAGSFLSVADTLMVCRFNAASLRADVASITIRDGAGAQVMRADLA